MGRRIVTLFCLDYFKHTGALTSYEKKKQKKKNISVTELNTRLGQSSRLYLEILSQLVVVLTVKGSIPHQFVPIFK